MPEAMTTEMINSRNMHGSVGTLWQMHEEVFAWLVKIAKWRIELLNAQVSDTTGSE
jgi:hypothetical protein